MPFHVVLLHQITSFPVEASRVLATQVRCSAQKVGRSAIGEGGLVRALAVGSPEIGTGGGGGWGQQWGGAAVHHEGQLHLHRQLVARRRQPGLVRLLCRRHGLPPTVPPPPHTRARAFVRARRSWGGGLTHPQGPVQPPVFSKSTEKEKATEKNKGKAIHAQQNQVEKLPALGNLQSGEGLQVVILREVGRPIGWIAEPCYPISSNNLRNSVFMIDLRFGLGRGSQPWEKNGVEQDWLGCNAVGTHTNQPPVTSHLSLYLVRGDRAHGELLGVPEQLHGCRQRVGWGGASTNPGTKGSDAGLLLPQAPISGKAWPEVLA